MASLSQRDAKTKNEAGVPLIFEIRKGLRGMDRIFPIVFRVEILIYLAFFYIHNFTFYKGHIMEYVKSVT